MMSWFLKESKRQKEEKRQRGERFLLNGKTLLKELIASSNGKYNQYRSFTDKEIKIATNNYDQQNLIRDCSRYSLYSSFLQDRPVSVLNFSDKRTKYGINSIVFASQMRHKIFLKLIGCCLETEAPILVFEQVENGTLADRIYRSSEPHFEPLLLTHRLKIAMEIANAIAYLHFGFSRPIIFRLIDPETIVFTEQYVAKLFDFSLAIAIPEGETHVEDVVAGTVGFLAPEYVWTQKCNETVDVYGFGVILLVLLTGLKSHQPSSWPTEIHFYDPPSSLAETHFYDSPIRHTETHFDGPLELDYSPMSSTETHFDGPLERDDSPIRPTETHFDGPLERGDSPIRPTETHFDGPLERDDSPISPTENHFYYCPSSPVETHCDDSRFRPSECHFGGPLARAVKKYIEQERFTEMVDPIVVGSGLSPEKEEQLQAFAELAFKCLSPAVDRPTMIDVAKQLRHIYKSTCQLMS